MWLVVGGPVGDADGEEGDGGGDEVDAGVRGLGEHAERAGKDAGEELEQGDGEGGEDGGERGGVLFGVGACWNCSDAVPRAIGVMVSAIPEFPMLLRLMAPSSGGSGNCIRRNIFRIDRYCSSVFW